MKYLLLALGGLLAALLLASVITAAGGDRYDPVDYARQEAEIATLARQAQIADTLAPLDMTLAALWRVVPFLVVVGALAYLASLGVAHVARFRHERTPNDAGLLPVLAVDQHAAQAALASFHLARVEEARRPNVPHSLAFHAPHYRGDMRGDATTPPALAAPINVPSFGELLTAGRIGRGQPLLLGLDAESGAELPGSWTDLYATATAGLPGSGKTTSQRFFAAQTALHGARFVVCDPHAGAADDSLAATLEPLRGVYLCEPASEPKQILEAVRYVAGIGEARINGRDHDTTPIILWVDELTGLLGRSDVGDDLAGLLEKIAQEYRKRFVYLSASGQIWTAARATSELRDSLASVLCHRMKRSQARLLLPTEEAATVERLATGEAILWRTSGVTARVFIPNTTAEDVRRVGAMLGGAPSVAPSAEGRPMGFQAPAGKGVWKEDRKEGDGAPLPARLDAVLWTPEEAQIVAALASGKKPGKLAEEMSGAKGGRDYQEAAAKIAAVIARLAARGGAR